MLRELRRLRPASGWRRALDVGCGDGLFFDALSEMAGEVEGVEPDQAVLSPEGERDPRIHVRPFDETFQPGRRYGLILFLDVLEHMDDAEGAVAHAASLLEEGGVMLVTVPAWKHLWTTHDELNRHLTRYTRGEVEALLGAHLNVLKVRYFFRWVHPAKVAQRMWEAVRSPEPEAPRVPPRPLNALLYGVSRVEEVLTGWLPVPLGSSVLGVARRE